MNFGIENLIGSVSYELASGEACQTKAQHEAGPSPSKPARHKRTSQGCARPTARQAQRAPRLRQRVGLRQWAASSRAAVRACVFVFTYET